MFELFIPVLVTHRDRFVLPMAINTRNRKIQYVDFPPRPFIISISALEVGTENLIVLVVFSIEMGAFS
jgi:hypothetical protein